MTLCPTSEHEPLSKRLGQLISQLKAEQPPRTITERDMMNLVGANIVTIRIKCLHDDSLQTAWEMLKPYIAF
ncbi:MAG TPA: hypothetical protein VFL98_00210 [Candidatus Paceibacterota bacterium]|nr:hypothetical protein [Candidatus Paceibacterota bacterium]